MTTTTEEKYIPGDEDFTPSRKTSYRLDGRDGKFKQYDVVNGQPVESASETQFIGLVESFGWREYVGKYDGKEHFDFELHLHNKSRGRFVLKCSILKSWTGLKLVEPLTLASQTDNLVLQLETKKSDKVNKYGNPIIYIDVVEKVGGKAVQLRPERTDYGGDYEDLRDAILEELKKHPLYKELKSYDEDEPSHPYDGLNTEMIQAGAMPIYGNEGNYLAAINKASKTAQFASLADVPDVVWADLGPKILRAFKEGKLPALKPADGEYDPFADE